MRIAINGFGRIGRSLFRNLYCHPTLKVVAINDIAPAPELAHYLKYDSFLGKWDRKVEVLDNVLIAEGTRVAVFSSRDWSKLPWRSISIDLVVEATRSWTSGQQIAAHLQAGATRVLVTANCPYAEVAVIPGINSDQLTPNHRLVSAASCTTQCLATVLSPLLKKFRVGALDFTVVHQVSADQATVDVLAKGFRLGRSALTSAIPLNTTATAGLERVFPQLTGKVSGLVVRVPTTAVSLLHMSVASAEFDDQWQLDSFHETLRSAQSSRLRVTDIPLVSVDYVGETTSAVVDLTLSRAIAGRLVTLAAWFDNEAGYVARLVELIGLLERLTPDAQ